MSISMDRTRTADGIAAIALFGEAKAGRVQMERKEYRNMNRLKELKEARQAAEDLIARVDKAISNLDSASDWSAFDLFFGGGMISSWVKRSKIASANEEIQEVGNLLTVLNKELEDVNMTLPSEISDTEGDRAFDILFDNIFTDIRVRGEIKDKLIELKEFRTSILELIEKLDVDISSLS